MRLPQAEARLVSKRERNATVACSAIDDTRRDSDGTLCSRAFFGLQMMLLDQARIAHRTAAVASHEAATKLRESRSFCGSRTKAEARGVRETCESAVANDARFFPIFSLTSIEKATFGATAIWQMSNTHSRAQMSVVATMGAAGVAHFRRTRSIVGAQTKSGAHGTARENLKKLLFSGANTR